MEKQNLTKRLWLYFFGCLTLVFAYFMYPVVLELGTHVDKAFERVKEARSGRTVEKQLGISVKELNRRQKKTNPYAEVDREFNNFDVGDVSDSEFSTNAAPSAVPRAPARHRPTDVGSNNLDEVELDLEPTDRGPALVQVIEAQGFQDPAAEERIQQMNIPTALKEKILRTYRRTGYLPMQLERTPTSRK